jgi:hypothetical protein
VSCLTVDGVLALLSSAMRILIFLMQWRADDRINGIIRTLFGRQELEKKELRRPGWRGGASGGI